MNKKILPDGSVEGERFTKNVDCPYPHIKDKEDEFEYHKRVNELVEKKGFHKGDLSWGDWMFYCRGSGQWRDEEPEPEEEQDYHSNNEDY